MQLCSPAECTGCMACLNSCPQGALSPVVDDEGFLRPCVDEDLCTDCLVCQYSCPPLGTSYFKPSFKQAAYACWTNDKELRTASSSGGVFSELAAEILAKNGVVYGAAMDSAMTVCHVRAADAESLDALRGSKYVQSRIGHCYQQVQADLSEGRFVLFSGTPCQIDGLMFFLGRDWNNLCTIDLVCHGVPSPGLFEEYKKYMQARVGGGAVSKIRFRDKRYSWIYFNILICTEQGKRYVGKYYSDPWIRRFLRDNFLRPSCYNCSYAKKTRVGDITIADYWGCKSREAEHFGVSLVITNSEKGAELFNRSKSRLTVEQKTIEEACRTNKTLNAPFTAPVTRDEFWRNYRQFGFEFVAGKWLGPEKVVPSVYLKSNFKVSGLLRIAVFFFRCMEAAARRCRRILSVFKGGK